jgi:phospholipid/cholesterol/gamma-HCH transport system substrate-binding protein
MSSAVHEHPRWIRAGFGCVGALLLTAVATVVLAYGNGEFDGGYDLRATFPSATQGLYTDGGSDVKLRGVNIGSVSGIELRDDGQVDVTLRIDDGVEVPRSVAATIEPLSVFGPKFVRLQPGAVEGRPGVLSEGDEIAETMAPVELTDILASATRLFEQVDPRDVVVILRTLADGVGGLGPEIGRSIDAGSELLDVGARNVDDTSRLLRDLAALATTLADHADDARSITEDLAGALPVVGEEPGRLDDLLDATTAISASFADLLADNATELDATIRAVATFVDGVHARADQIPDLLHLIDSFFGRLSDVIRFDGPADTQMAGLRGFIALDPCLVYGACL